MSTAFAINGLGRIGRCLTRIVHSRPELQLVAVNDLAPASTLARLLRRDSVHGPFAGDVKSEGHTLFLAGHAVDVYQEREPQVIPWPEDLELVVDATGQNTRRQRAARHFRARGPQTVVISAISDDADLLVCPGIPPLVDPRELPRPRIIAAASCTTHCLALLLDVLQRNFGIENALMSEAHGYTANQNLVDAVHDDPRRGRAAAINIVPTHSAAPAACEKLIPSLRGKLQGRAIRVPTPDMALLDLVAILEKPVDLISLHAAFDEAAAGRLAGLLATSDEFLVSTDFIGDPHSAILDKTLTQILGRHMVRLMAWYDNEWGYANRLADLLAHLSRTDERST